MPDARGSRGAPVPQCPSPSTSGGPDVDAVGASKLCFSSHSPTLRPWIADAGVLRGGDLEPAARRRSKKSKLKQALFHERSFHRTLSGFLSQAGPRFRTRFSSSWASPLDPVAVESPRATKKGDLVVALVWLAMRLEN